MLKQLFFLDIDDIIFMLTDFPVTFKKTLFFIYN